MKKQLFIDGVWVSTPHSTPIHSVSTKEELASIAMASVEDVKRAISAAHSATAAMRALTSADRADILIQLAELFKKNRQKAAEIISIESAKPLKYALAEIDRTIETYRFSAEEAKRLTGEMIPMEASPNGRGRLAYTIREPIGVVAAITPFNFPQNLVAHKVGPAIAAGNSIVMKPATQTALSAIFLAELLEQTALPKGAFNLVTGSGPVIGDAFLESPEIRMVTFTGSPEVGISLRNRAGLKKVTLELGSNAGLIIDEGVDLDKIVDRIIMGAFSNQGQVCISLQRIYVMESIMEDFIVKCKKAIETIKIGNPLDPTTELASMISEKEQQRALSWINEAIEEGAELITGGCIENNILLPTLLKNAASHSRVICEEIFAPVVTVNPITTIDEGIAAINDSNFGLQAGIFTKDIQTAFKASKSIQAGGVLINDVPTYRVDHMPYGGVKNSGTGREGVKYAIEDMTELKLIIWNQN